MMLKSYDTIHYGICIINNLVLSSNKFLEKILSNSSIMLLLDKCFLE